MMHLTGTPILHAVLVGLLLSGCGGDAPQNPAAAEQTYGAPVDATDAIPVPAVAAEAARYTRSRVTVGGRIAGVMQDGCVLHLATGVGSPLRVDATRTGEGACRWQVPGGTDGFAVVAGTLRADGDALRLSANGVRVTPVHTLDAGSSGHGP